MESTSRTWTAVLAAVLAAVVSPTRTVAQDDVADVKSQDILLGQDKNKRYFRIGPKKEQKKYGLVVIMPGGSGSAEFHPFCKRIYKHAVPDEFVAVQPVAVKWNEKQEIVWPKAKDKVKGARFTTEQFVEEVIADAAEWVTIDPKRVFVVCWSSSGPAAYSLSLTKNSSPTGYFMAMSVFKKQSLPSLKTAKGKAYFIYHSEQDKICPYRMAKEAEELLTKAGAKVEFLDYQGGHGWRGPLYRDMEQGLRWLEKNHSRPPKTKRQNAKQPKAVEAKESKAASRPAPKPEKGQR